MRIPARAPDPRDESQRRQRRADWAAWLLFAAVAAAVLWLVPPVA
jgi:ferric-dicitrate binding protein FerR (iron transport regulator)